MKGKNAWVIKFLKELQHDLYSEQTTVEQLKNAALDLADIVIDMLEREDTK